MGFTPVNTVTIERNFNSGVIGGERELIVKWHDDITGDHEKRFGFREADAAFEFAAKQFKSLSM